MEGYKTYGLVVKILVVYIYTIWIRYTSRVYDRCISFVYNRLFRYSYKLNPKRDFETFESVNCTRIVIIMCIMYNVHRCVEE